MKLNVMIRLYYAHLMVSDFMICFAIFSCATFDYACGGDGQDGTRQDKTESDWPRRGREKKSPFFGFVPFAIRKDINAPVRLGLRRFQPADLETDFARNRFGPKPVLVETGFGLNRF